ncbi:MAG: epimerase, partial [Caldimonas sp.]
MTTHSPHPTVLILGANGRFGMAAAKAFDAAGWRVLAQVRRDAAAGMPVRAEVVRVPLDAVAAALAGRSGPASLPSVVIHAVNPIYTRWEAEALPAARAAMGIAEALGARFLLPG